MAAFEVIALDTATPQLRAPGASDTYTFPRASAFSAAITYGGVTLNNAVTGTGNMVLSASPTFSGTATFASVAPTANTVDSVGYTGMPANSQSAAYTTVAADAGKTILHPATDNNARTFTIDSNANVPYPVGTVITFVNMVNTVTIAITSDTLYLAGDGSTGSRTLGAYGVATAIKVSSTAWVISGNGLT